MTTGNPMADQTNPKPDERQPKGGGADERTAGGSQAARREPANDQADAGAPTGTAADLSLREQLEAARAERDSNYDQYLRAQAELQNYRKRAQKELDEFRLYESLPLARDLLPALDNLHRALSVAETAKNVDELVQGVRMVVRQIETAFARHHILPIESTGKSFDPHLHQAIQQVPTTEHPPMTVIAEVERGFKLKDRVVRPASVIVASAPPWSEGEAAADVEEPNADV